MKPILAVYPGTFDPITYGHIDVVERAAQLFQRVVILVARNTSKAPLFTDDERIAMIREVFRSNRSIEVDGFDGLLVDYARQRKASVIVRGLRAVSDFEIEFQMALTNRKMSKDIMGRAYKALGIMPFAFCLQPTVGIKVGSNGLG